MSARAFRTAFPRTIPVMAGYLVMGIAFGLMLSALGFGPQWAVAMSTLIYAGSGQFLCVGLLEQGAALAEVALLTLLLHFRHFFYGLSMISRYPKQGIRRWYLMFGLTDETYALLSTGDPPPDVEPSDYYFATTLLNHLYWIAGGLIGATAGHFLPFDTTGVDFAMTALFVVLAVDQWKSSKQHASALCGLCCGVVSLLVFGPDLFLIPALISIAAVLLLMRNRLETEEEGTPP